jgi:hypothetical protein
MRVAKLVAVTSSIALAVMLASRARVWAAGPATCTDPTHHHHHHPLHGGGRILPDGPGNGWGFPNDNPDHYGWFDHGLNLPLGGNRVGEYYFPRYYAIPPTQAFLPSYYNPYLTRGQRYVAYVGCGGAHPAGGYPPGSAETPIHPYQDTIGSGPRVRIPAFNGRIEASPINSGGSGLTP